MRNLLACIPRPRCLCATPADTRDCNILRCMAGYVHPPFGVCRDLACGGGDVGSWRASMSNEDDKRRGMRARKVAPKLATVTDVEKQQVRMAATSPLVATSMLSTSTKHAACA